MEHGGLIYFDNGATSYPKPPEVIGEVVRSMIEYGGNPGRGAHKLSLAAAEKIYECRTQAAELFGVSECERVFFTENTTHGLNTVIKGLLSKGDHVLISDMEHNAVYRPIYKMAAEGLISYDIYGSFSGDAHRIYGDIARKMQKNTKMVIAIHSSNICSLTLPIKDMAAFCHSCGLLFVVDGAQSAGHEKIDVDAWGIDALCLPGHKGLYGPQGCGVVALGKNIVLETLTEGGNGVNSLLGDMPVFSPERYEAGTLPTPAIAGLLRGMEFVKRIGMERLAEREKRMFVLCRDWLLNIGGITVYRPELEGGILLFNVDGMGAEAVGAALAEKNICVRSGYHCSALGHRALHTDKGGAVRVSFGAFNTENDVRTLCREIECLRQGS